MASPKLSPQANESTPRRRGRPAKYDRDAALDAAIALFSQQGYSGASIDGIATAMGMTKPSVYNAFGDKQAIYQLALERFVARMDASLGPVLDGDGPLVEALERFYCGAIAVYFELQPTRGCFVFCTAPVEALEHPHIAALIEDVIGMLDRRLRRRFARALDNSELPPGTDVGGAAKTAQAVLHSIAIRARAGESRRALERFARQAAKLLGALN